MPVQAWSMDNIRTISQIITIQMKASFTDATLHKPVQWPQRKIEGSTRQQKVSKGELHESVPPNK